MVLAYLFEHQWQERDRMTAVFEHGFALFTYPINFIYIDALRVSIYTKPHFILKQFQASFIESK